ncbi:hypothetical protein [Vagococcus fluvialis]|uniref:hypothetical protein n=1 Tax=Vagococcus fluvialis TaxID=2738 RepID=UPI001D0A3799|nr:hypothetical protein [Vagococcus fluvialis]UDM72664.1 hypothetical protein K5L00_14850 [Vagococcus fluvialis]UDM78387.1 hypothetical protein K5K98_15055 [Vagococcus fluvialis]UDM83939.1 hypothetical protein K5K96_14875 [Vagococcus fluvialis]
MKESTHMLSIDIGIDFTKVLSEPYLSGVMLALNIKNEKDVIAAYSKHLSDTILSSISGREELEVLESGVSQLGMEEQGQLINMSESVDEVSAFSATGEKVINWNVSTELNNKVDYVKDILASISETDHMPNLELKEIQVREEIYENFLIGICEDLEVVKKRDDKIYLRDVECVSVKGFDEDESYGGNIPYKLVLNDVENNETTIIGGI